MLAPRPARGPAKQCMDSTDSVFLAIHECSLFARADCLRALVATGNLGYQIGSGALVPVWSDHVLPFLVTRTSRPLYPWSVVGYARELGGDESEDESEASTNG